MCAAMIVTDQSSLPSSWWISKTISLTERQSKLKVHGIRECTLQ
jgi:hypothetical protein